MNVCLLLQSGSLQRPCTWGDGASGETQWDGDGGRLWRGGGRHGCQWQWGWNSVHCLVLLAACVGLIGKPEGGCWLWKLWWQLLYLIQDPHPSVLSVWISRFLQWQSLFINSYRLPLKGGWGCLMFLSCLKSQGCHCLIPISFILLLHSPFALSCPLSGNVPLSPNFSPQNILLYFH